MRQFVSTVAVVAVVALFGCNTKSTTKKSIAPATTGAGAINPENTKITFVGTKPDGKHEGGFKTFSGTVKPATGDVTASTISVEIDTTSLYSDNEKLTGHLKAPDFFEVKKHPTAKFTSKAIKAKKAEENTHEITGDLTLHGETKEINFPAKIVATDDLLTIDATFTIDRTEFGMAYDPKKVSKTVTITVASKVARK